MVVLKAKVVAMVVVVLAVQPKNEQLLARRRNEQLLV